MDTSSKESKTSTSCNSWLVIGSSAGATRQAQAGFFHSVRGTRIIAAGRGILAARSLNMTLDYYLLYSRIDAEIWKLAYNSARRTGTKIIACNFEGDREPVHNVVDTDIGPITDGVDPAHVHPCDAVVSVQPSCATITASWQPGQPFVSKSPGLMAIQFALDDGADIVHMAGFEGFTCNNLAYFDGPRLRGSGLASSFMSEFYGPTLQNIMEGCPDTRFTMFGTPSYQITAPNLEIKDVPTTDQPIMADPGQLPERADAVGDGVRADA